MHTHRNGFDEEMVQSVVRAGIVGDGEFLSSGDAGPHRDGPFHLLNFGFLVLVAILQPGREREGYGEKN